MDLRGVNRGAVARRTELFGGAVVLGVFVLDQLSKLAVTRNLQLGQSIEIVPRLLSLRHVENPALAFGTFGKLDSELLAVPLIVLPLVLAVALVLVLRNRSVRQGLIFPAALILGGAAGNLADRIARGAVIDWLGYQSTARRASVYNLADLAILTGMLIVAVLYVRALLQAPRGVAREYSEHAALPQ